jgi:cytochrome c biogenesis protein CcdA
MKKLVSNSNPFILLLAPVVFAIIMGVSYQFEQKKHFATDNAAVQATSLFVKGISVVKTVCSIATEKLW